MTHASLSTSSSVAIIGGGPAGLMAAQVLALAGVKVELFDTMPSVGRKFLLAGVGGMNITHAEAKETFVARYGERQEEISRLLAQFDAEQLRAWIHGLGIETFVGSSGRVFPSDMKAAPLLRAWLKRLREHAVTIHTRSRWLGWTAEGALRISTHASNYVGATVSTNGGSDADSGASEYNLKPAAVLLALGGGSWARLGSDGAWVPLLQARGVAVAPLQPSNCGFEVAGWSGFFQEKFAGAPVKSTAIGLGQQPPRLGEFVITAQGVEGSLIYALSAPIRQQISAGGSATIYLDLLPHLSRAQVETLLRKPRGSKSQSTHLHRQLGLDGVRAGLLRELSDAATYADPSRLAAAIKALPLTLVNTRPLDEAISSAGGVPFEELDEQLMLRQLPGVFCAGEMLDWEAPTGGYLLTACLASGRVAGLGLLDWLRQR